MKLKDVLKDLDYKIVKGEVDIDVLGLEHDSRNIKEGYLFIAIDGFTVDGHDYIENAVHNGAVAIVISKDIEVKKDLTVIRVDDDKEALARLASNYYDKPSEKLDLIGITGTNGKTSITYMLKSILETRESRVGIIGTMGSIIDNKKIDNANTTPESLELQNQINKMVSVDTDYCLMEVSSHSLDMKRVEDLDFQVSIFTNLTEDHLDYHLNMENYFQSKKKLFTKSKRLNIINGDDPYGQRLIKEIDDSKVDLLSYGLTDKSDVYASNIRCHNKGVDYKLHTDKGDIYISMHLLGNFNVYNSLAAISCALYYGYTLEEVKRGLENVTGIKGRFELVRTDEDYSVIIDFAHTPDGLEQVLKTTRDFSKGRIIVVFGAGGDRDRTKRPIMGETVGKYSDLPIVTSDNPRFEDPDKIIEDVVEGVKLINDNYISITDRKEAIKHALQIAKKGDTIILAGKGHETYISINGETIPFDEKEIVIDLISEMRGED